VRDLRPPGKPFPSRCPELNATHQSANGQGQFSRGWGEVSLMCDDAEDIGTPERVARSLGRYSLLWRLDVLLTPTSCGHFNSFPTNTNSGSAGGEGWGIDPLALQRK